MGMETAMRPRGSESPDSTCAFPLLSAPRIFLRSLCRRAVHGSVRTMSDRLIPGPISIVSTPERRSPSSAWSSIGVSGTRPLRLKTPSGPVQGRPPMKSSTRPAPASSGYAAITTAPATGLPSPSLTWPSACASRSRPMRTSRALPSTTLVLPTYGAYPNDPGAQRTIRDAALKLGDRRIELTPRDVPVFVRHQHLLPVRPAAPQAGRRRRFARKCSR